MLTQEEYEAKREARYNRLMEAARKAEEAGNAALIAAAPDLLAALQDCYSELNQLAFLSGDKLANIALDKARAAIQKATE